MSGADGGAVFGGYGEGSSEGAESLSDEELARALDDFSRQFAQEDGTAASHGNGSVSEDEASRSAAFDEELEGLLGNRAKVAVVVTRLVSAELLAAFCTLTGVRADCLAGEQGAAAVLRDLEDDAPEVAAGGLTAGVEGLSAVLVVNRADHLEATLYMKGSAGESMSPPVVFASAPGWVEDLMLGIATVDSLRSQGGKVSRTDDLDAPAAVRVVERYLG